MFHILSGGPAETTSMLVMIVVMIVMVYFMMIRPEKKRKKEAEQLRSSVTVGDEITTIGGITGVVVEVKDERFVMESGADRVRLEMHKWAISTNDTATKKAKEQAEKAQEARAKAAAEKKAKKNKDK